MASSTEEIDTGSPTGNEHISEDLDLDMIDVGSAEDFEHHQNKSLNEQLVQEEKPSSEDTSETKDDTLVSEEVGHVQSESRSEESSKSKHATRLPMSRIKSIMKADEDCSIISQDAVFLVTKATEMFIESLAKETIKFTTSNTGKRKVVSKKEVDSVIDSVPYLCFLDGIFE